jgi:5'-methylthioadenosine phosphorylase
MSAGAGAVPTLGIIGGSAFLDGVQLDDTSVREVPTPYGTVAVHLAQDFVFLRRHGERGYRPPHRIPHHAHVLALHSLGVRRVAAFASAGALRVDLRPGDVVIPDDYLSWHAPPTFAGDDYLHIVPALDAEVRELLIRSAHALEHAAEEPRTVEPRGVYAETRGPRFETKAEIRMIADYADVVGMTAASEATLCQERGIGYAVICIVDNWAHGVGPVPLALEEFRAQVARNAHLARALLHELIRLWRARAAVNPAHQVMP